MNQNDLIHQIRLKKSMLCVGLDSQLDKIPRHLLDFENPILEFNKRIIDATKEFAVAYKPNLAFYEALGDKGLETLRQTLEYLPADVFKIADAKRGDIGNTSLQYAKTFFEYLNFDSITLSPYMGVDSIAPYLSYPEKSVIILALTSNGGSKDFQMQQVSGAPLYQRVIEVFNREFDFNQVMYVVGATHGEQIKSIRNLAPNHFFLVPGIGAQGGEVNEVMMNGINQRGGLLINASRSIIYRSSGVDFDVAASKSAQELQMQMAAVIDAIQ